MTINRITESAIEELSIELLEKQGYKYLYGPDISPDTGMSKCRGCRTHRSDRQIAIHHSVNHSRISFSWIGLHLQLSRINPTVPADAKEDALKQILRLNSPELIANN